MGLSPGKAYRGMGMEGPIARWYAVNTGKGMDEFKVLARNVAASLAPGSRVLEVAPGPGYFAIELSKRGYHVEGLDISKSFVEIATRHAQEARTDAVFRQGNASQMPYEDGRFDFVFCRAAFKNFSDPLGALREMGRVLRPGGKGLLIDLRRDASPEAIRHTVDQMGLNLVNRVFTRFVFRRILLRRAYTERELREYFGQAGFQQVEFRLDRMGFEIHFTAPAGRQRL